MARKRRKPENDVLRTIQRVETFEIWVPEHCQTIDQIREYFERTSWPEETEIHEVDWRLA